VSADVNKLSWSTKPPRCNGTRDSLVDDASNYDRCDAENY
jgi:hypothetical protein